MVGKKQAKVSRVLIALDITPEVIAEAIEKNVDLIVTHHPVIWGTIASVTDQDQTGRKLLSLIENGIAAICAHTNLDAIEGGVNSELARRLKLTNPIPLHEDGMDKSGVPYGIGRVGDRLGGLVPLDVFVLEVKEALALDGIRVLDSGRPAFRIAVGGGSCGSNAWVFDGCNALNCITIPSNVGKIAFGNCTSLTRLYFDGSMPTMATNVFENCSPSLKCYYQSGKTGFSYGSTLFEARDVKTITVDSLIENGIITAASSSFYRSLLNSGQDAKARRLAMPVTGCHLLLFLRI